MSAVFAVSAGWETMGEPGAALTAPAPADTLERDDMAEGTCRKCQAEFTFTPGRGRRRVFCDSCSRRDSQRRYKERNPEQVLQSARTWRAQNPEEQRDLTSAWRTANAEKIREKAKQQWAAIRLDPNALRQVRAEFRRWAAGHRQRLAAKSVAYQQAYPEKARAIQRRRRARRAGATVVDFTERQWSELLTEYEHRCAYCGVTGTSLQREHVTPLALQGDHTKSNIVPACGPCNWSKSDRPVDEFLRDLTLQGRYGGRFRRTTA